SVTITRGGAGTGRPFVDVTNDNATVTYDVTNYPIGGTNNIHVVGVMSWVNSLGGSGTLPAATPWEISGIGLSVGANVITVTGTNVFGEPASDNVTITRGGAGTGRPFVDVTNDNATVTYDVTSYTIGGTNNIHVVGVMNWVNSLGGSGTLPAATPWEISGIGLSVGANVITVTGTNVFGDPASDSVTITRGGIGTGIPFVDITNPATRVEYNITEFSVAGTNNIHVVGVMLVSNEMNGATADFPAALSWTAASIELAYGPNMIVVYGTNYLGQTASDSVIITRTCIGTGTPYLDVTTTPTFVTYDVKELPVSGTNNVHVVGDMIVSNAANGVKGVFSSALGWVTPPVSLEVGPNEIFVYGYNLFGVETSDSVEITRGGIGTGEPFVDITNAPMFVTYDVTVFAVAGTNNIHVMGGMLVSNAANGATADFSSAPSWTASALPLAVGDNEIIVIGTNYLERAASDSVIITRGGIGTGAPFVDVTNVPATVTYDVGSYTIGGTNNLHVVGMMSWESSFGSCGTLPATTPWEISGIPLSVGANVITVIGTNVYGELSSDMVTITRGGIGTGEPFVDITNTPAFVTYDITGFAVAGTNNIHVMGGMLVSNAANGAVADFAAAPAWTSPSLPLAVGANEIIVIGTNYLEKAASDSVIITRGGIGTGKPFVDVTTPEQTVLYTQLKLAVEGTNNLHVVGEMVVSNTANGEALSFAATTPWTASEISLNVGDNMIVVSGTNVYGESSSDSVLIKRLNVPADVTILEPNGGEDYSIYIGAHVTNIYGVTGGAIQELYWSNLLTKASGLLPLSSDFDFPVQLEEGINEIIVYAVGPTNTASDSITITVYRDESIKGYDVLCTWPELIGSDQTGTVEFTSARKGDYTIFAVNGSVTQTVANGTCAEDWNLVPFYSGDLPMQLDEGTNNLFAQINDKILSAGHVIVVRDLGIGKYNMTVDDDGDLIKVIYKSETGGRIEAKGRTLYVTGGSPTDKIIVKVKKAVLGDKSCRISGIITDGGFVNAKVQGTLDKFLADGPVRKLMTKFGSLGHKCKTKLHNVRFDSDAGKSFVKVICGDVNANVFSGKLNVDPEFNGVLSTNGTIPMSIEARKGIRIMKVKGGYLGIDGTPRWVDADHVRNVIVKPKKLIGGNVIDYSFQLTGEEKLGKSVSIRKIISDLIVDTSGSNAFSKTICGYDESINPQYVTNWFELPVKYTIKKIKVIGGLTEGSFILKKEPLKKKITGDDKADWIINGILQ
ncbi:MAG: hypothetical protein GY845_03710, partial [Planctomycetes bacterium]|nr:hypothetical protein [Planctomycetota bacterium]